VILIDYLLALFGCPNLFLVPHLSIITEQKIKPFPNSRSGNFKGRKLMSFSMTDSQQVTLTITATDKKGNPATIPAGSITWAVDNPALLTITPAADSLSAVAASVGPLGTATISVKVADGSGSTVASGSVDCTVVGGGATNIVVNPGTPSEQP
jgi:hypothetical protein